MTKVREFVWNLAAAGHSAKAILQDVETAFHPKAMTLTQIYRIIKAYKEGRDREDQRGQNAKKTVRTPEMIVAVKDYIESDRRVTYTDIEEAFGLTPGTVNTIIKDDLGLIKKSARWVPRLLDFEQKKKRVDLSMDFCKLATRKADFLQSIVTMDESAVSFHTPETKAQSKQWLPKGTPGPLKARTQASRRKQMVISFFDCRGMVYQNYVSPGTKVNADYIVDIMGKFLRVLRRKRPDLIERGWFLHWDNAPVHTAKATMDFLDGKGVKVLPHAPYSPDLASADFWLFPTVKAALAGVTIKSSSVRTDWERVCGGLPSSAFLMAFNRWLERHSKCVRLEGDYVEKTE